MRIASLTVTRICTSIDAHVTLEVRIFHLHNNVLGTLDSVTIKVDTIITFILLFISLDLNHEIYLNTTSAPSDIDRTFFITIIKSVSQNL